MKQIAQAGRATGAKIGTPKPRIDMVIQPKQKEGAAQPAPNPAAKKAN